MLLCGAGGGDSPTDQGEEHKFRVLESRWNVEKDAIGEGGFGTVHLCKDKSGKQRACKAMRLPTALDREDFRHEVAILKSIKTHRNICHVVDSAEDARFGYLVMQSCTGGELFDRIAARKCTEKDAAMAVLDVLSALDFIHARRIIHRDLKVRAQSPAAKSRCAGTFRFLPFGHGDVRSPRIYFTKTKRRARR
jgi:serine/threonine protein kinase